MEISYNYEYDDLNQCFVDNSSILNKIVLEKWIALQGSSVFNYKLNVENETVLPGSLGFYIQLNRARTLKRRKPQAMSSLTEPFDPDKFNFNKISSDEVLMKISYNRIIDGILIINASPLTIGHCLFCPNITDNLPQQLTLSSLEAAVRLIWLIGDRNARIGYNSPGALASVNHLHLHLLYVNHRLAVETVKCKGIASLLYEIIDYPASGFCLILSKKNGIKNICERAINIVETLIELNIPHNVMITFGEAADIDNESKKALRILIFPRRHSFGCKLSLSFNLAFCELSGFIPVGNSEAFESLSEENISHIMKENTWKEFKIAKEKILSIHPI